MRERRRGMMKWLGENGGELVGSKKYLCVQKVSFVYKLDSFVGFIGDEQVHAQECYEPHVTDIFHQIE
jgi:hypothetical protein